MGFDFAELRAQAKRVLHDTLGIIASYTDDVVTVPVDLRVRHHSAMTLTGDPGNGGYAEMLASIDSVILDREELNEKGITVKRGGKLTLADGSVLILDSQARIEGPIELIWRVALK